MRRIKSRTHGRCQKTEEKINQAIVRIVTKFHKKHTIKNSQIAKEARINRTTLLEHYSDADAIMNAIRLEATVFVRELLNKYYKENATAEERQDNLRSFIKELMFYIRNNSSRFMLEEVMNMTDVWTAMLKAGRPILTSLWPPMEQEKGNQIFDYFSHIVISNLEAWGEQGFSDYDTMIIYMNRIYNNALYASKRFNWTE